ncbi:TVP38/TMEM64 family protein [Heliophilum fasciatum]|uniref:TVP38/TMEM64 family membrane protein n=1 Tax=Heliophilum fasciatum TaxID=35700 RepID=A0A4R2RZP4_9FIRM|nr:TVP38/TMEM64 family protein [Heliophilum fasciatum]MCW2276613.1 putative membrane protein YdjX (TVP38/TMEM64 family) [Heliophilum fasciatum]TCP69004.1 putative membrane protein YdjX (TVP38/TMEM64 family) [Heliophilum fasciatum]
MPDKNRSYLNIALGVLLFALLAGLYVTPAGQRLLLYFTAGDASLVIADLQSFGWLAWIVAFALVVLQNFLGFIPSVFLSGVLVMVFGWLGGFLIAWAGEVAGAICAFAIFRYYGRSWAAQWLLKREKLAKLDAWTSQHGLVSIILLRLAPLVPSGVINFAAALSSVSFASFTLGTAIGKAPSLVLEVIIGHDMWNPADNAGRLAVALAVAGLIFLVLKGYHRKTNQEPPA